MAASNQPRPLTDADIKNASVEFLKARYEHLCKLGETNDTAALGDELARVYAAIESRALSVALELSRPQPDHVRPLGAVPRTTYSDEAIHDAVNRAASRGVPFNLYDARVLLVEDRTDVTHDAELLDAIDANVREGRFVALGGDGLWKEVEGRKPIGSTPDEIAVKLFNADCETVFNALCDKFRADRTSLASASARLAQQISGEVESYERLTDMADGLIRNANALRALVTREHHAFLGSSDF